MIASTLIAFLAVNTYYHQKLRNQNDEKNMRIAESITNYIEETPPSDLEKFLNAQAAMGYKFYLVNATGEEALFGENFREHNLSDEAIESVLKGNNYHGMRDLPSETFVTGFFSDELANTVGKSFDFENERYALFLRPNVKLLFTEVHYLLGGMVLVMAFISLIAMLIFAKKLIEPIAELTLALKKVGNEQFSAQVHINRKDEIGQLAQSFHQMTEKLSENDRMRKEFISDVSHDFQSPLLNIKGYAGLLINDELTEEERKGYATIIRSETSRLSSLTKQLLLLTSLDQLSSPLDQKLVSLDKQLREVVRKYRWLLEEKEITLSMDLETVNVQGDPAFLEKVWENLLSNALKYTPSGGIVNIHLAELASRVEVSIEDNGIGIEESKQRHIFERFYRVDNSRTSDIEGTGLGLSIVQQVVKLHKGEIQVESEVGIGTKITVLFSKL